MENENVTITPVSALADVVSEVTEAMQFAIRCAGVAAEADESSYGANVRFAQRANDLAHAMSPGFKWYTLDKRKLSGVSKEFGALVQMFWDGYTEARNRPGKPYKNMSKTWSDIRGYALVDAQERGLFGEVMPEPEAPEGGEGEGVSETVGGTQKRNPDTFIREDMVAAYKRLLKDDADCSDAAKVFRGELLAALKRFGITGLEG